MPRFQRVSNCTDRGHVVYGQYERRGDDQSVESSASVSTFTARYLLLATRQRHACALVIYLPAPSGCLPLNCERPFLEFELLALLNLGSLQQSSRSCATCDGSSSIRALHEEERAATPRSPSPLSLRLRRLPNTGTTEATDGPTSLSLRVGTVGAADVHKRPPLLSGRSSDGVDRQD